MMSEHSEQGSDKHIAAEMREHGVVKMLEQRSSNDAMRGISRDV